MKKSIKERLTDIEQGCKILTDKLIDLELKFNNLSNSASQVGKTDEPNENLNQSICEFCGSKDKVEYHNGYGYTCQICKENQID